MANDQEFDAELFETKLENLKDTQEGITKMSSWCLSSANRVHHKKIVNCWLNVLKRVRVESRLTLFYLANDVIQYSKRKHYEFVESWGTALQKATTMVRDEKVKHKISRIFKIWEQRHVYGEEYLSDLKGLLNMPPPKSAQKIETSSDEFQPAALIQDIRDSIRLSNLTDKTFKRIPKEPLCDLDVIKGNIKDRASRCDADKEIDAYVESLQLFIASMRNELRIRKSLINNLTAATNFYQSQRGEVKVVVNAYRQFGNRMKAVKKKLEEVSATLPSPMPSPDINAPSPEPDPEDRFTFNFPNGSGSFMDKNLPFDINDFKSEINQPIEVISNRSESESDLDAYNPTNYYNPKQSTYEIPGLNSQYSSLAQSTSNLFTESSDVYKPEYSQISYGSGISGPPLPVPHPTSTSTETANFDSTWNMDMSWMSTNSYNESDPSSSFLNESAVASENATEKFPTDEIIATEDVDHRQIILPDEPQVQNMALLKARTQDIDRRNLISLTGSPIEKASEADENKEIWNEDQDFRSAANKLKAVLNKGLVDKGKDSDTDYRPIPTTVPPPPLPPPFQFPYYQALPINPNAESVQSEESVADGYDPTDQIESIDMDMSDDDNYEKRADLLGTPVEDELPEEEVLDETSDVAHDTDTSALLENPHNNQYYQESEEWSQSNPSQFKSHNPFQQPRYPMYPNPQQSNFSSPPMNMRPPFPSPQGPPRQGFQQRNFHPNFRQNSNFRGNMRGSPYFPKGGAGPRGGANFNGMGNRGGFNIGRGNFRGGPRW